jgi:hypothetical protein
MSEQIPPSVKEGQVVKTWAFTQNADGSLSPATGGSSGGDVNIADIAGAPPALSNPLPVVLSDGTNAFGTPGNPLSVNVIAGGGSNASVGATNSAAPSSATELGIIDGSGKLQGVSGSNPVPFTVGAPQVIQKSNAVSTGAVGSLNVLFANPVKAGNTLIAVFGTDAGSFVATPTITDNLGNTWKNVQNDTGTSAPFAGIRYAFSLAAGACTVTLTAPAPTGTMAIEVYEIAGLYFGHNFIVDQFLTTSALAVTSATSTPIFGMYQGEFTVGCVSLNTVVTGFSLSGADAAHVGNYSVDAALTPATPTAGFKNLIVFSGIGQSVIPGQIFASWNESSNVSFTMASFLPYVVGMTGSIQGVYQEGTAPGGTVNRYPVIVAGVDTNTGFVGSVAVTSGKVNVSGGISNNGGAPVALAQVPVLPAIANANSPAFTEGRQVLLSEDLTGKLRTLSFQGTTPTIWRGNQFTAAGQNILWTPPSAKKARLMKYKIEVSEDATISGGPLPINLAFTEILGTASQATFAYPGWGFTHRLVVPSAVLATSGSLYDSDWIDLGNGQLLTSAATASVATQGGSLAMGIMVPQPTAAVNPTFTIASNQWEAATIGFKTNGSLGNFKLVQTASPAASTIATTATSALQLASGNSVFVVIRTRNIAGGAPTIAVTDTAGNTYTVSALTTNASDGTNGSSIAIAYVIGAKGNAANIVTVTTSVHIAAATEIIYLEYAGLGTGGIDAALVGATGNSTSPASGNYTPATAGDLILSFFGTNATISSQPTVGSNFRLLGSIFTSNGCLSVSDNFGNGSLLTGVVNTAVIGTEE